MKCINRVELLGNITQDIELKTTNSGKKMVNITVATNKRRIDQNTGETTEQAEFHRCVAWNQTAENIAKYLHKGSPVFVSGELHTRTYEKDGQTKYITEILINDLIMLPDGKGRQDGANNGGAGATTSAPRAQQQGGGYGQATYTPQGARGNYGNGATMRPAYDEHGQPLQPAQPFNPDTVTPDQIPF